MAQKEAAKTQKEATQLLGLLIAFQTSQKTALIKHIAKETETITKNAKDANKEKEEAVKKLKKTETLLKTALSKQSENATAAAQIVQLNVKINQFKATVDAAAHELVEAKAKNTQLLESHKQHVQDLEKNIDELNTQINLLTGAGNPPSAIPQVTPVEDIQDARDVWWAEQLTTELTKLQLQPRANISPMQWPAYVHTILTKKLGKTDTVIQFKDLKLQLKPIAKYILSVLPDGTKWALAKPEFLALIPGTVFSTIIPKSLEAGLEPYEVFGRTMSQDSEKYESLLDRGMGQRAPGIYAGGWPVYTIMEYIYTSAPKLAIMLLKMVYDKENTSQQVQDFITKVPGFVQKQLPAQSTPSPASPVTTSLQEESPISAPLVEPVTTSPQEEEAARVKEEAARVQEEVEAELVKEKAELAKQKEGTSSASMPAPTVMGDAPKSEVAQGVNIPVFRDRNDYGAETKAMALPAYLERMKEWNTALTLPFFTAGELTTHFTLILDTVVPKQFSGSKPKSLSWFTIVMPNETTSQRLYTMLKPTETATEMEQKAITAWVTGTDVLGVFETTLAALASAVSKKNTVLRNGRLIMSWLAVANAVKGRAGRNKNKHQAQLDGILVFLLDSLAENAVVVYWLLYNTATSVVTFGLARGAENDNWINLVNGFTGRFPTESQFQDVDTFMAEVMDM